MHSHEILTSAQVRNMIRPADPDNIFPIGDGTFRAEWMPSSSPIKDEMYLRGKSNIEILVPLQRFEISDGSMFLYFRIKPGLGIG